MTKTPLDESLDQIAATLKPYLEEHMPAELARIRGEHRTATVSVTITEDDALIKGLAPLDWTEVLSGERPPPDWLCEPILEAGKQAALFAEAKAGKSLLVLEICCGIAAGRAVLGNPAREPRAVVVCDMENGLTDIAERVTSLGYAPEELTRLHYYSFPSLDWLNTAKGGQQVAALAARHDAALVVVDTLSRVVDGDENDAETYHAFYRYTGLPLKARGIALIRLDHAGKDASRGMRGSSAKTSDVDAVWALTAEDNELTLTRTHTRNAHGADRLVLTRSDDPLRHEPLTGAVSDPVTTAEARLDLCRYDEDGSIRGAHKALVDAGYPTRKEHAEDAQRRRKLRAEVREVGEMFPTYQPERAAEQAPEASPEAGGRSENENTFQGVPEQSGDGGGRHASGAVKPQVNATIEASPDAGGRSGDTPSTVKGYVPSPNSASPGRGTQEGTTSQTGVLRFVDERPLEVESVADAIARAASGYDG